MKRQNIFRITALLLCFLLFFNGTVLQVSAAASGTAEEVLLQEINAQRAARGLQPLVPDATLRYDAQIRAQEITYCFSHARPDGTPWYYLDYYRMYGETLAAGYDCSADGAMMVVSQWMSSPAHAYLLMYAGFRSVGFGITQGPDGCWYWTAELGY